MKEGSIWIWNDKEDNLWKFVINENGDLIYQIMYTDGKWTNKNKIDEKVLEFSIKVDTEENIHIIYTQQGNEIKYCTYNKKMWLGKTLYKNDDKQIEILELDMIIIGEHINTFFVLVDKNTPLKGKLIHYTWNEYESIENGIFNIDITQYAHNHYSVEITEKDEICLFFINYEEDKSNMDMSIFRDNKWSSNQILYGIKGEEINFTTLTCKDGIHILNSSKESNIYVLEDVHICFNGEMIYYEITQSDLPIKKPALIEVNGVIWSIWSMGEEIVCSFLDEQWSEVFKLYSKGEEELLIYNGFFENINNEKIKAYNLWGINSSPIKFILPSKHLEKLNNKINISKNNLEQKYINEDIYNKMRTDQDNYLEKDIINYQLQQKESLYDELESKLYNTINKNIKTEEKCNIFKKAHKESQEKLKEANIKLEKLNEEKTEIMNMLKEANEEIKSLKESLQEEMNKSIIEKILNRNK